MNPNISVGYKIRYHKLVLANISQKPRKLPGENNDLTKSKFNRNCKIKYILLVVNI